MWVHLVTIPAMARGRLHRMVAEGVIHGDAAELLPQLPAESVDLFFTSPPYADARAYSRIHPDRYVEWFLPYAEQMLAAAAETGSLVLGTRSPTRYLRSTHPPIPPTLPSVTDASVMQWRGGSVGLGPCGVYVSHRARLRSLLSVALGASNGRCQYSPSRYCGQ
jgi:hypothetical protein